MADELEQQEIEENNTVEITQEEKDQEKKIRKEIEKLQFYLEDVDELLESEDFNEIKQVCKRTQQIQDNMNDLVSHLQELKIEPGKSTQRSIRQWTRDLKAEAPLCEKRARLCRVLDDRQRHENLRAEEEVSIRKMEKEEQLRRQIQQQET
jgi:hypothetical protein